MTPEDRDFIRKAYLAFRVGAGLRSDEVARLFGGMGLVLSNNRLRELGRDSDRANPITPRELHALISAWADEQKQEHR